MCSITEKPKPTECHGCYYIHAPNNESQSVCFHCLRDNKGDFDDDYYIPYLENPKTAGSGMYAAIPQSALCPNKCPECFFQNGRSYLEPLEKNTPNLPPTRPMTVFHRVIRCNDGHDSFYLTEKAIRMMTRVYPMVYFNTSIAKDLEKYKNFKGELFPVVLTINPQYLDVNCKNWTKLDPIPKNVMMIRILVNIWNFIVVKEIIQYYTSREISVILTFMAYNDEKSIPEVHKTQYCYRKRTLNSYWAITTDTFHDIMQLYQNNKWVYSCGKIEGEKGDTHCRFCGNCLREYFACKERLTMDYQH